MDTSESMKLSYESLKEITDNFSKQIGCGAYGVVYKGANGNGKEVAVKVLHDMNALDDKEFANEFQNLAKLDHQNIVQLVGYCNESEPVVVECDGRQVAAEKLHVALCFEYVSNGNLGNHISDEKQGLQWHIRYKIIKGICEGLNYLHKGLQEPVLHLDLKPGNILLNKEMEPKIADFGLSRLIGDERTKQTMNKSIGTHGYLPPEYMKFQLLSPAFDIFSLGVIITKVMVGRERYHDIADMPPRKLVKLVHTSWKNRLKEIVGLRSQLEVYSQQVKTCIEVASKCLMEDRHQRPNIQEIVATLNETEIIHSIPSKQIEEFDDGQSAHASRSSITAASTSERGSKASRSSHTETRSNSPSVTPRNLPFNLLKDITDGFSHAREIGRGGSGVWYKGIFEDGTIVAVKILHSLHILNVSDRDFKIAVMHLYNVQHENIVQLVGYCAEMEMIIVECNGRNIFTEKINRALCFVYLQNGSLDRYISDVSCELDWCTRYKIMKGICEGVRHLHEGLPSPILHLNLKPGKILLDENMTPKIGDFLLSRQLDENQSQAITTNLRGTMGYMAPEYIDKGVISKKGDIFSLGVIIMEIITGRNYPQHESSQEFIEYVLGKWRKRLQETSKHRLVDGYCQQVTRCIQIVLNCLHIDRHKRPSIGEIINALDETETWIHEDTELLDVQPLELRFTFKPKKHASCLLQLRNKQDDLVAFRISSRNPKKYHTSLPLHGMVPPRCTYTLALTTSKQRKRPPPLDSDEGLMLWGSKQLKRPPPSDSDEGLALWSVAVSHSQGLQLENLEQASASREYENILKKAQESANDEVQEVTLKSIFAAAADEASSSNHLTSQNIEIIATLNALKVSSLQVHPTEPWILTTHEGGNLRVWNYKTMEVLNSFEDEPVYAAKFVAQEQWIVAGDENGCIHVYSSVEYQDSTSFEAHDDRIMSLAVHPTDSYVLSSSHDDHQIKLWHWDMHWDFEKGPWACIRTFEGHTDRVSRVVYNPEDRGCFASASWDGTVKIWGINNPGVCKTITSNTHQDGLLCVDFITGADRQRIITGSKDQTAQIWDLEIQRCREYLQGHTNHVSVVYYQPDHQKLITGSLDGTIRIWDSMTYRLENIIALNLGAVSDVGYIEELQRIIVGCYQGIAMVEINFHELSVANKG